jgi:hypothetical protein
MEGGWEVSPLDAREMWKRFEPIHAVTYFTPEALAAYEQVSLRGYWRGYFAGRAAPLGRVGAAPAVASFFVFAPAMVRRALPDVWRRATPTQALQARRDGACAALTRLASRFDATDVKEAAELAEAAIDLLDPAGHLLGAANLDLPRDTDVDPLARLWQCATTLREHRGDGHVAALVAYGFDGVEAVVWRCAPGHRTDMQRFRGWTDDEWEAAVARLTDRGWLASDGTKTAEGEAAYGAVELATDRAASQVWEHFGHSRTQRLLELLTPLAMAAFAEIPTTNPIGLPAVGTP